MSFKLLALPLSLSLTLSPIPIPNPNPNPNPNPEQVKKMPRSLAWFNHRLEHTIFPAIAALFPEIVAP